MKYIRSAYYFTKLISTRTRFFEAKMRLHFSLLHSHAHAIVFLLRCVDNSMRVAHRNFQFTIFNFQFLMQSKVRNTKKCAKRRTGEASQAPDPRLENLSVFHLSSTGACAPFLFSLERKVRKAEDGCLAPKVNLLEIHFENPRFSTRAIARCSPTRETSVSRPLSNFVARTRLHRLRRVRKAEDGCELQSRKSYVSAAALRSAHSPKRNIFATSAKTQTPRVAWFPCFACTKRPRARLASPCCAWVPGSGRVCICIRFHPSCARERYTNANPAVRRDLRDFLGEPVQALTSSLYISFH